MSHPKVKEIKAEILQILHSNDVDIWEAIDILANLFMAICDKHGVSKNQFLKFCISMNNAFIDARNEKKNAE